MKILIEVTTEDIINSVDPLKEFITFPLKAKVAYQVARLVREIEKEYNLFQERRSAAIHKFADKDKNDEVKVDENGQIHVAKENVETFTKEINELLESKVELNAEKIKLNDLNCDVSSQMMINLMPFIEIEE